MKQLTFVMGGDLAKYKVDNGIIYLSGKHTNFQFIELVNPNKVNNEFLNKLKKQRGEAFVIEFEKDLEKYKGLNEDQIVEEIKSDLKKDGWRLAKVQ